MLAIVAAVGATRLPTDAGVDTLVDSDVGDRTRRPQQVREDFGEEPVVVLVKGELPRTAPRPTTSSACCGWRAASRARCRRAPKPIPGPCAELAELEPVEFLTGPATFLNESVVQIDNQLRRLAENVPPTASANTCSRWRPNTGSPASPASTTKNSSPPSSSTSPRPRGTPKARLAYLFPNAKSAQIVIRLRPDLSEAERHRAIGLIEEAVAETTPRKACKEGGKPAPCFELESGSYVVSGAPVVVDGVSRALKDALLVLFAVALAVMAAGPLPRLPLPLAAAAAGWSPWWPRRSPSGCWRWSAAR